MISLKDLVNAEDKELTLWYQEFRHNLLDLLDSIKIDKIYGSPLYRLIIMKDEGSSIRGQSPYDKFCSLVCSLVPKFTDKNTYEDNYDDLHGIGH